ncbi:MAG: ABC transporter permease [Vicinamibacterales bacterium]
MDDLLQDLRFGLRVLWRQKTLSLTAVLTLAVCVGANVAIFCVVNGVVLRPLPFAEPDRLVHIYNSYPKAGVVYGSTGVPDYYDRRSATDVFEEVGAFNTTGLTLGGQAEAERIIAMRATPSLFRVLKVEAQAGRLMSEEDGEVGRGQVVVLSDALWKRLSGGRADMIGQAIQLSGRPYTVIGVMPEGFQFWNTEVAAWVPLRFTPEQKSADARHSNSMTTIARLRRDVTLERAQQVVDALNVRSLDETPGIKAGLIDVGFHSVVVGLHDFLVRDVKGSLSLLWAAAVFLLLIGAVNVANLALVRASGRRVEVATRQALGAGRWRIARQVFTENAVITAFGAGAGLLAGYWALRALSVLDLERLTRVAPVSLDGAAVAYTLGLALAVGLLVGAVPLAGLRGQAIAQALRDESRSGTASRGAQRIRRALVASQVMLALILVAGSGLLLRSFRNVLAIDPGFRLGEVWTGTVNLPSARYPDAAARRAFEERLLERVRSIAEVIAAGTTDTIPLGGSTSDGVMLAEGQRVEPGKPVITVYQSTVSPGYFEAMGIPLVRGRFFEERDTEKALPVIIVDDRLARRFWPGQDPIGKRMYRPETPDLSPGPDVRWLTVVGVVGAVRMRGMTDEERLASAYFASAQQPSGTLTLAVRGRLGPSGLTSAIRREVAALDPEMPVYGVSTMEERRDRAVAGRRTPMVLSVVFGGIALLLAAIGLYGVLAYQIALRRREIGIRLALGSDGAGVFALIMREGLTLLAVGAVAGLAGTLVAGRAIAAQLYGVGPWDPGVLSISTAVLAAVGLAACFVPARRASRIDPAEALSDL